MSSSVIGKQRGVHESYVSLIGNGDSLQAAISQNTKESEGFLNLHCFPES